MDLPGKLLKNKAIAYSRLFSKLRKRRSSGDDLLVAEVHDEVFSGIDCLDCANCCKTHSPLFTQRDIERISKHLKQQPSQFVSEYLVVDEDGDWVFHTTPCPFLANDNKCSIYDMRPQACREYPHTNRKKLYQIEDLTLKNAEICPAVTKILDIEEKRISNP